VGPQLARRARAYRHWADRLAHLAETIADRELCRDVSAERDRLRCAAAHADRLASMLEAAVWLVAAI
jgi:hypothetical protein